MFRHGLFFLLLCSLLSSAANAEVFLSSQTGTGGVWRNPALLEDRAPKKITLGAGGGGYINDRHDLIDGYLTLKEEGEALDELSQQRLLTREDTRPMLEAMEAVDGKLLTTSGSSGFLIPLPQIIAGIDNAFVGSAGGRVAATFTLDERDRAALQPLLFVGVLSSSDFHSRFTTHGVSYLESGFNFSKSWKTKHGQTDIGALFKYQLIALIERSFTLSEYDEDDLIDFNRDFKKKGSAQLDLGFNHRHGQWEIRGAAINLHNQSFTGPLGGKYKQRPGLRIGGAYYWRDVHLFGDLDISPTQHAFGLLDDERRAQVGLGLPLWEDRFKLYTGYQKVLDGRDRNSHTLGADWQPWQWLHLQGAVMYAGAREFGGAFRAQLRF